jgi:hypothetical protein
MGDIHYIVDKLNAKPFQYKLTLLSFRCGGACCLTKLRAARTQHALQRTTTCVRPHCSEKSPVELLQLLSDVFSTISPKHQVRAWLCCPATGQIQSCSTLSVPRLSKVN